MILDIISAIIIIVFIIIGVKNGAAKVIARFLAAVSSFLLSVICSHFLAELVYNLFIKQTIINKVNATISDMGLETAAEKTQAFLNSFPLLIRNAVDYFGAKDTNVAEMFQNSAVDKIESFIKIPVVGMLSFVFFIILFVVLFFLLKKLFTLLAKVFRLPVIRVVDSAFGFLFGIAEGVLAVYFIVLVFRLLIPLIGNDVFIINEAYINESYFFSLLYHGGLSSLLQSFLFSFDNF